MDKELTIQDLEAQADALLAAADERTKLLWLCSPNNPTGAAYDRAGLKAWVDYANKQNAVIFQ